MITDQDVLDLYRCLLGRAPETDGTVTAFRTYYPEFGLGRLAVLGSDEFSRVLTRQTGRVTADLTTRFLQRAGGVAQPDRVAPSGVLADAMRMMVRAHGAVRLAVVVGQDGPALADILPLENAQAAILHVAPDFPAFIPQTATLPAGGTLFRIAFEPSGLVSFLTLAGLRIDMLALCGAPAAWWDALLPCLADRAILAAAGDTPFPRGDHHDMEAPIHLPGLSVRHWGGWFLPVMFAGAAACDVVAQSTTEQRALEQKVPGLTVAAIVRNEQDAAVNMLASVLPVAGHIVVLDTGSTDDTVSVVETFLSASNTPCTLARAEPGRFDSMRNAALDLVPASTEWVLMLDADEELCAGDRAALRALLADADHDAYALPRYNYAGSDKSGFVTPYPDRQVRLLRCGAGRHLRYEGAVHETVRGVPVGRLPLDAGALGLDCGGPHIHHLVRRFRSPEAEARKQDYYRSIAREAALQEEQL